jgi:hypothetical protein
MLPRPSREAERAVLDYLERTQNLSPQEAINLVHCGLGLNRFTMSGVDPELKRLVVAYKNAMGNEMQGPHVLERGREPI